MADLTQVFIFGVIFPTIITVLLFIGFLICWYKCDIRERFLKKCFKKKFNSSQKSTTSVTYIKDASLHGSRAGSRTGSRTDRHYSGSSSPCCHTVSTSSRANHSNLGFEPEDSLPKPLDGHVSKRYPPLYGPLSPYNKKPAGVGEICPIPSTGIIGKTEVMLGSAMDPHVPPNSDSGTYSMAESQNSITERSSTPRDHIIPWHTPPLRTRDNVTQSLRITHESRTPPTHEHSDIQTHQQEYRFPQPARSCSRDATRKTSQSKPVSMDTRMTSQTMDNSSSSYSSSDGDDYGHFVHSSKVKDKGHKVSEAELRYTPGYVHKSHTKQPANSCHVTPSQSHVTPSQSQISHEHMFHSQNQSFHGDIRNSQVTSSSRSIGYDPQGRSRNPLPHQYTHSASLSPDSIQLDIKDYLHRDSSYHSNDVTLETPLDTHCVSKCIDIGGVHFIHNSSANVEANI